MKTRFLIFALLIFAASSLSAQITSFFDNHQDDQDIEYIEMTKDDLFTELKVNQSDKNKLNDLAEKLELIQVIISEQNSKSLFDEAYGLTKNGAYESLINIRSKGDRVLGYVLEEDGIVQEWLLLLRSQDEVVIGRVLGEFKMSDFTEVLSSIQTMGECSEKDRSEKSVDIEIKTKTEREVLDFAVYPNPIRNNQPYTISFENTVPIANAQIVIRDLSGKELQVHPISDMDKGRQEITLKNNISDISGSIIVSLIRNHKVLSEVILVH